MGGNFMTVFKKIYFDEDTIIFLTMNGDTIVAVGNIENILDEIQEEINKYMEENNLKMVNIITANDFDIFNYEKI